MAFENNLELTELQNQLATYRDHLDNLWVEDGVYFLIFGIGMGLVFLVLSNIAIVYSQRYMDGRAGFERRSVWLSRLEPAVYFFGFITVFAIAVGIAEDLRVADLESDMDAIGSRIEEIMGQGRVTA